MRLTIEPSATENETRYNQSEDHLHCQVTLAINPMIIAIM